MAKFTSQLTKSIMLKQMRHLFSTPLKSHEEISAQKLEMSCPFNHDAGEFGQWNWKNKTTYVHKKVCSYLI